MSDDLRTRISAIMEAHDVNSDCGCPVPITNWFDHMADAVIRGLGLRQEWLTEQSSRLGIAALTKPQHPIATRIASPWIAQEPQPRRLWDIFAEADQEQ